MSDTRDFKSGAWGTIGGAKIPWQGSVVEPQAMRINVGGSWRDVWENFSDVIEENAVIASGHATYGQSLTQYHDFPNKFDLDLINKAISKGYTFLQINVQYTYSNSSIKGDYCRSEFYVSYTNYLGQTGRLNPTSSQIFMEDTIRASGSIYYWSFSLTALRDRIINNNYYEPFGVWFSCPEAGGTGDYNLTMLKAYFR